MRLKWSPKEAFSYIVSAIAQSTATTYGLDEYSSKVIGGVAQGMIKGIQYKKHDKAFGIKFKHIFISAIEEVFELEGYDWSSDTINAITSQIISEVNYTSYLVDKNTDNALYVNLSRIISEIEECDLNTIPLHVIIEKIRETTLTKIELDDSLINFLNYYLVRQISDKVNTKRGPFADYIDSHLSENQKTTVMNLSHLDYRSDKVLFQGREHEIDMLEKFLESELGFSWWLITGKGGTGKSRLAHHFLLTHQSDDEWKMIFLNRDFFIDANERAGKYSLWYNWYHEKNLFLVIDYVQSYPEYIRDWFMQIINSDTVCNKIRVLLIEREGSENTHWYSTYFSHPRLRNHCHGEPIILKELDEIDLYKIAHNYANGRLDENQICDAILKLKKIDDSSRAIYLLMILDAVIDNQDWRLLSKRDLSEYIISKEYRIIREKLKKDKLIKAYCRFLAFCNATMEINVEDDVNKLPEFIKNDLEFIWSEITQVDELTDLGLSGYSKMVPLTPDLVGEYMAIDVITTYYRRHEISLFSSSAWLFSKYDHYAFLSRIIMDDFLSYSSPFAQVMDIENGLFSLPDKKSGEDISEQYSSLLVQLYGKCADTKVRDHIANNFRVLRSNFPSNETIAELFTSILRSEILCSDQYKQDCLLQEMADLSESSNSRNMKMQFISAISNVDIAELAQVDSKVFDLPISFLSDVFSGGTTEVRERRVVILGNAGAGKTSLLANLTMHISDEHLDSTEVRMMPIVCNTDDYRVEYFDFSGHEIMHQLYRLFIKENTTYIIVLDARYADLDNQAVWWLQEISVSIQEADIILVINKIDICSSVLLNETLLRRQFPQIRCIIKISTKSGKGIDYIEDAIKRSFETMRLPRLPTCIVQTKQWIEKSSNNYITQQELFESCREFGISSKTEINLVIKLLGDVGFFLTSTPALIDDSSYILLINPRWLFTAIHRIYMNATGSCIIPHKVIYELINMPTLWDDSGRLYSPFEIEQILNQMRKHMISYALSFGYEFFPSLMKHIDDFQPGETKYVLTLSLSSNFMTLSILHRLCARLFDKLNIELSSRYNAIFVTADAVSSVCFDNKNTVSINVYSDQHKISKKFLRDIAISIKHLLNDQLIDATEYVHVRIGNKVDKVSISALARMVTNNMSSVYLQNIDEFVDVLDIIEKYSPYARTDIL